MYLEIYPDVVFLINLFINIGLIYLVKKVNKKNSSKLRIVLASAIGALGAAIISIFPWINSLVSFLLLNVVSSLLMLVIAFGRLRPADMIKQWIVLYLITYFVGGFMNSIYYHTNFRLLMINISNGYIFSNISALYAIITASAIFVVSLFILWIFNIYQLHKPLVYDVELFLEDRHMKTRGLMDTGNCLYDPIYRRPVMIMEKSLIDKLLSSQIMKDMEMALSYIDGKSDVMTSIDYKDRAFRFSFIPYRSVGKTGMLLGIRLDKVMIHTENESICNENVIAAICENKLTDGRENYHVILHKELL